MKADPITEAAVKAVLDKLAEGYINRDLSKVLSVFAPDPDVVVLYGTAPDGKRVGLAEIQAQVERDWSQFEFLAVTFEWTSVSAAGTVAWVATEATFKVEAGGQEMSLPARITSVVQKRGEAWLIVQSHLSFRVAAQA